VRNGCVISTGSNRGQIKGTVSAFHLEDCSQIRRLQDRDLNLKRDCERELLITGP
jgi:hypothetical protein